MYNDEDENVLLFPYAYNKTTGEYVTPSASHDVGSEHRFYNEAIDKGHLVCPECMGPHLTHRSARSAGGSHYVRDHFAAMADEKHNTNCSIGVRSAKLKHGKRIINEELGPFFYLNTGAPKPNYPHGGKPTKRAWIDDPKQAPDWLFRVQYARHTFLKHREIISPELVYRARIDAAKNVTTLLKNFARIHKNEAYRHDTWAIVNGVAIRLDKMVLREGIKSTPRDMSYESLDQLRKEQNLPRSFKFPSDAKYDKFALQLNQEQDKIMHPVLLHFKVAAAPKQEGSYMAPKMVVNLGNYDLQGQIVERLVHIKDRALFPKMVIGAEFFALAHPYMSTNGRTLTQNFNVFRESDLTAMTLLEFKAFLENPRSRKCRKSAPPEAAPQQISIPA